MLSDWTTNSFVSHYLKQEMRFRGITQDDLRKTIGRKSQSYISDRLNDKNEWGLAELDKIAHLFGQANAVSLIISAYNEYYSTPISRSARALEEASQKQQEKKAESSHISLPDPEFPSDWASLAADHDPNKRAESETPEE